MGHRGNFEVIHCHMKINKLNILVYSGCTVGLLISTAGLSQKAFGDITLANLIKIQIQQPLLWEVDAIILSSLLLAVVFTKFQNIKTGNSSPPGKMVIRLIGFFTGTFIYGIGVIAQTTSKFGKLTFQNIIDIHLEDPSIYSLLAAIPFITLVSYIIEKMLHSAYDSQRMSVEIQLKNELLESEIKERKEKEKELLSAKSEALAGIKAKDQFLSNMSHEIRTPMNGIIGLVNLLANTPLNPEQQKYVTSIQYASKNLLSLINQILDLSRINSEKLTLDSIDFNVREVVEAAENTFTALAQEKSIVLRTVIDNNVPEKVCGDPARLNQILLNLIGNAVKFTEEGGIDVLVSNKDTDDGPRLSIQVNDTGIGIPKNKLKDIFETFTQANLETTRKYGGSGLGLAISKELIELFGGSIHVESTEGEGSSFYFEVQLKPASKIENAPIRSIQPQQGLLNPANFNILLAEDNKVNQLVASTILKKMGFNVEVVSNGQEVIEIVFQRHFDLILMDLQMPIMGGLDATRFIRKATDSPLSEIKIIALSASTMKEEIEKCYNVGMDDHLAKPFERADLEEKLFHHLANIQASQL